MILLKASRVDTEARWLLKQKTTKESSNTCCFKCQSAMIGGEFASLQRNSNLAAVHVLQAGYF